jgi:hypothetical protein
MGRGIFGEWIFSEARQKIELARVRRECGFAPFLFVDKATKLAPV